jgi:hypothetical protein
MLHHSRYSSVESIFPSKGSRRSLSAGSHRSDYASTKPFPTPGISRSRVHSKASEPGFDFKSVEEKRLDEDNEKKVHWKRWGPYLSERQWVSPSMPVS